MEIEMQKLTFEQVFKSYNGRTGCACGCNGNYTLPSHVSLEAGNKDVGYNAYNESDVSDRRVKLALNKVNKAVDEYGPKATLTTSGSYEYYGTSQDGKEVWFCYSVSFVAVNVGNRATTVYFQK
jgi:hypothetical protein